MPDVTERLLALLALLQTGRAVGGGELARHLGVAPRTLRRDVDRLRSYGYPVETRPGPGGFYRLAAGRAMPPLVLDDDEAVATLVALAALGAGGRGHGGVDDAAARAYGKLDQFLPARLRPRAAAVRASVEATALPAPTVTARRLGVVADAVARRETVTFGYVDAHGAVTGRRVDPYRLVHHLLRWYLVGWDVRREDWRTFRLDRVRDLSGTAQRYRPRPLPADTAVALLRRGLRRDRDTVTVRVAAPAAHVADVLGFEDAEIRPAGDGRTEVEVSVASWHWLVLHLALLDAEFRLEADAEIVRACRRFADRLTAALADDGAATGRP